MKGRVLSCGEEGWFLLRGGQICRIERMGAVGRKEGVIVYETAVAAAKNERTRDLLPCFPCRMNLEP
jgi:hypothetical protein